MRHNIIGLVVLFSSVLLNGCAYYGVRYGFEEPQPEITTLTHIYDVSTEPAIKVISYCSSKGYNFLVGPVIGIPLPVIPSLSGIMEHYSDEDPYTFIEVSLSAPPTQTQVKDSRLVLLIDSIEIPETDVTFSDTYWKISKRFKYRLDLSCTELSNKQLVVQYISSALTIRSPVFRLKKQFGLQLDLW